MENSKCIALLNDLLHITNDRIRGFSKVEDKVWNTYPALRREYDNLVSQSVKMKNELSQLIIDCGGTPDESGSIKGALHRAWIDIKNTFTNSKETDTTSVVYGEQAAIEAYEKALDSGDLCNDCSHTVLDQLHHLRASHERFEHIEELKK